MGRSSRTAHGTGDRDITEDVQEDAQPDPEPRISGVAEQLWPADGTVPRARSLRLRMARADPASVLAVSSLVSLGLAVCAAVTLPPVWILLALLGRDPWPSPGWALALGICAVVLTTASATVCSLLYNVSCRCAGGVELTLAEDAPAAAAPARGPRPEPAEQGARPGP
ncbi:DUF3566 domain-containing protein [Streptomyces sp. NPDC006393]|uniref:DUF3566 domain-containing protein n=1 Tax=Streptomyces sp. NPDC006393 TaxID=3156763 RepID=UPI0033D4EFA0